MLDWLRKDRPLSTPKVDLHSHLIPNIDDGVKSLEESIALIKEFESLGYEKVITTPHIHPSYPNDPEIILAGLESVQRAVKKQELDIEIEAAAEYFVDETFFSTVKSGQNILSFGGNLVLVESSFVNKPLLFEDCMFELMSRGYQPILAHPERYRFLDGSLEWLYRLKEMGVMMQATIGSFAGFYGQVPREISLKMAKDDMLDFLGSDMHHHSQMRFLREGLEKKQVKKLLHSSAIKNTSLR